ncbi:hypothetical protein NB717_000021 [Xanthomonas sacchari]|uniref:hypothetical protein n=1 Tax=Xanthomonas sacchari TaxID=56458 RepID=UPI00225E6476|nr:hypothetical protein [Xanthomonas sacchari]MCW0458953.1 hypothetical protein [Xanthomonas sacchari]
MSDGSHGAERALPELVGRIWAQVIAQVNTLINAHEKFGFVKFGELLDPSLKDVVKGFELVDFALSQFEQSGLLGYDERRDALNSRQCILKMKLLAAALDGDQEAEAEEIMAELRRQSKF